MNYLVCYLLTVNVLGLLFMLTDKHRAKKNRWRIPESRLMLTALLGGSAGVLAGMYLFHHKTLHLKFSIGVPVILAVQAVLAALLLPYLIH